MDCANCDDKNCTEHSGVCTFNKEKYVDSYMKTDRDIIENSYNVTSETKGKESRVNELILFSKKMGYKKLGLAFCKGLSMHAKKLDLMLKNEGFEVSSVCCKICDINKSEINVSKINKELDFEVSCNPLAQAEIINNSCVDLTITVGFCMGHDILFFKHIKSSVSPLVIKDRMYGHNPLEGLK